MAFFWESPLRSGPPDTSRAEIIQERTPVTPCSRPLALLVALLLAGCSSQRYHVESSVQPGKVIDVQVFGDQRPIVVENRGPGRLLVSFDSPAVGVVESSLGEGQTMRTPPGTARLLLKPEGDLGCEWRIEANAGDGLATIMRDLGDANDDVEPR